MTEDGSPSAGRTVALWEPPLLPELTGENGAPVRRPAGTEAARMLADLVVEGARTLAFVRSRRGAEVTALGAQRLLAEVEPELVERVAAYRGGYLPEERRALEAALVRAVTCSGSRPPTRSSWAWTSPGWTPWWWPVSPAPARRSGSRRGGRAAPGTRPSWCSWPATTRWTPTSCTIPARCSAPPWRAACWTPATRMSWRRSWRAPPRSCR